LIYLVTGAGKRAAVDNWRNKPTLPASRIAPTCGVDVFIEESLLA
jgi:6-phosphogluconolactonase